MEVYLGTIMPVGFNYAPKGWALCAGQLLPIQQNQALFALLGTQYGGDGIRTFALPDLRGRTPAGLSALGGPGQRSGTETVTLTPQELPPHNHQINATSALGSGRSVTPQNNIFASPSPNTRTLFASPAGDVALSANNIGPAGGSQPHDNMQPYLVLNYIIALQGVFPPHS